MQPLFTIGHSNHSQEKFIELLECHGITALAVKWPNVWDSPQ
ncbi:MULTISPECIES: hypothetical protein [unclassified Synechocystis]|nr:MULTISPECIES: hypothetical protein [unclassified Synechocystis]